MGEGIALSPLLSARLTRYPAPLPLRVMDRGEPPVHTAAPQACAPVASEHGGWGADMQGQAAKEEPQALE